MNHPQDNLSLPEAKNKSFLKKLLSNTLLFVFIILFVKGFSMVFGQENTLVGVAAVIGLLVFLTENLMDRPFANGARLFMLSQFLGISAFLSSNYPYAGIGFNFLALFVTGYALSYKMDKVLIIPFGLQYLFMLYTPVSAQQLPMRLLALGCGIILIMLVQLLVNRNKPSHQPLFAHVRTNDDHVTKLRLANKELTLHYTRAAYALRIGIVTAVAAFLVFYFQIPQGRWIVYTVFSLTELYSENCLSRSKERLEGSIIGVLIIIVLFFFIKDNTLRGLLVLAGGYMDTFTNSYRQKMICVTISVVASISIIEGTAMTAVYRIGCVLAGIVLAVIADKLILRRSHKEIL